MKISWRRRWLRRAGEGFSLAGFLCVGFCVFAAIEAASAGRASENLLRAESLPGTPPGAHASEVGSTHGLGSVTPKVMGRLEIPAIALSVPILSDYETESLLKGVGHIPGTAMPGGLGLAGQRDTYFRTLAGIKPKMDIRVVDHDGVYHYAVDSTEIVKPEDVGVLDIQSRPELTLVTCYPFHYVGAAPLRFIVHAHLLSALPDPAP